MKLNPCANRVTTPFGDFQVDVDNLFDHVFGVRNPSDKSKSTWTPRVSVSESETGYSLQLELPGVDPADVNLEIVDSRLEVSGTKADAELPEGSNAVRDERYFGDFRRTFEFSKQVDAEKISARYQNGVLEVSLPKSAAVLPKKIQIEVAES